MTGALALLMSFCANVPALQEREGQPPPPDKQELPPPSERFSVMLGAHARFSRPSSSMEQDINILSTNPNPLLGSHSWSDFYQFGTGGALQADFLWRLGKDDAASEIAWALGPYWSVGISHYRGRQVEQFSDAHITPDDLDILTFLAGAKFVHRLGDGFFVDGHVGMGPVHFSKVDADLKAPGDPEFRGGFIADTWAFGAEIGGHVGVRTGNLAFVVGIDFRALTGPDSGRDVQLSAKALLEFGLDLAIEFRF